MAYAKKICTHLLLHLMGSHVFNAMIILYLYMYSMCPAQEHSASFHFKNEHSLFLYKTPRQSMSILIYEEEIVVFSLRVGL